jgi:hypothetical protein
MELKTLKRYAQRYRLVSSTYREIDGPVTLGLERNATA